MNGEMPFDAIFPRLGPSGYTITSPASVGYNCIAWAAGDEQRWWWPDKMATGYWPSNAPREETLEAFVHALKTIGYTACESEAIEPEMEKVAIYCLPGGKPTHVARQLPNGKWTSKLGKLEDIEHTLDGLVSSDYGSVGQYLKRPIAGH